MFKFDPSLLLQAFGLIFMTLGLAARLGLWKKWYWRTKGSVYGYIPLGLMFLLYSFYGLAKERLTVPFWWFQALFAVLLIVGLWWSFRPPSFVKPAWVRWVEAYPKNITTAMEQATAEESDWDRHVTSPEAIEAWVKGLKLKKPRSKGNSKAKK